MAKTRKSRRHPHLRELLVELATEVALNRGRLAGDSVTLRGARTDGDAGAPAEAIGSAPGGLIAAGYP
jgi:hypothetical protein